MKTKKIKSTRDKEVGLKLLQRDEYAHFFVNAKLRPVPDAFLEQLAIDLISWVEDNPQVVQLIGFLKAKGIYPNTLRDWKERNESLKNAYNWTMFTLGQRREHKALTKDFDSSFVRYTMPLFDEDYKNLEEWRAKLREANEDSGTKIVVLEKFPETKEVPKRKE